MKKTMLLVLLAMVLTACGGGTNSSDAGAVQATATSAPVAVQTAGPSYSEDMLAEGDKLFHQTCFTCHGPDGTGIEGLGKDLTTSAFVADSTDEELLAYVTAGRPIDDPANTSGVAMPPKGGFDFLQDEDIQAIIAYVRSIHE